MSINTKPIKKLLMIIIMGILILLILPKLNIAYDANFEVHGNSSEAPYGNEYFTFKAISGKTWHTNEKVAKLYRDLYNISGIPDDSSLKGSIARSLGNRFWSTRF